MDIPIEDRDGTTPEVLTILRPFRTPLYGRVPRVETLG
jgi:hypothetical protein